jgi:hypothetical protein
MMTLKKAPLSFDEFDELPALEFEDEINEPKHYHKNGIDVIGFAELHYSKEELKGFYRINIIKYVDRYDTKGGLKSLEKAEFYLKKLMELENNG